MQCRILAPRSCAGASQACPALLRRGLTGLPRAPAPGPHRLAPRSCAGASQACPALLRRGLTGLPRAPAPGPHRLAPRSCAGASQACPALLRRGLTGLPRAPAPGPHRLAPRSCAGASRSLYTCYFSVSFPTHILSDTSLRQQRHIPASTTTHPLRPIRPAMI
jgi:hypothetical protein